MVCWNHPGEAPISHLVVLALLAAGSASAVPLLKIRILGPGIHYTIPFSRVVAVLELRPGELEALAGCDLGFLGAVPVVPGRHELRLLFENTVSKEFAKVERDVIVPPAGEFGLSSVLLARKAFRAAPPPGGPSRAFQIGDVQLYPLGGRAAPEKERIFLFFQILNPPPTISAAGRIEAEILKDGGSVLRVAAPVSRFAESGNVLLELPTEVLPAGSYRLRAAIREADGREAASAETPLEIAAEPGPPTWVIAQKTPPPYDPYYAYALGIQGLELGEAEAALPLLGRAHANDARNVDYGLGYARALLARKEPAKARAVLLRFTDREPGNSALWKTLGRAAADEADFRNAAAWFERASALEPRAVDILNALGDCRLALGDAAAAAEAWAKSLALDPGQEEIRKKLSAIK